MTILRNVECAFRERSRRLIGGRYRLHEQLGGGAHSHVWRATDEVQGRVVTVKRLAVSGPTAEATAVRDRILREARAAGSGHHPHLVPVLDVVVGAGELWVVQEHVPARTLAAVLAERGQLPARDVSAIGAQVASALAAAHAAGVVHRNVNPGNILVAWPFVKLDDFGITPAEATPVVDRRNDIHALGAVLYAAVGGHRGTPGAGSLMPVLAGLMAADPAARPTAAQAEAALREVVGRAEPVPVGTGHRWWAMGLVIGLVAGIITTAAAVVAASPAEDARGGPMITAAPPSASIALGVGDPRTADPCALVDEPALRRHGLTDVEPYVGPMASCWAYVAVAPATEVAVSVELMPAEFVPEGPGGVRDERGPLTVVSHAFDGTSCVRRIDLPDTNIALVVADATPGVSPETICAVADTAVDGAVARLLAAGVPARPTRVDTTVLAGRDACRLLTVGDLRAAPGVLPTPVRGLADWSCRWGAWAGPNVTVTFWRRADAPGKEESAIDVGGRPSALYRSPSGGGCTVTFPQQRFDGHVEAVSVYVYDQRAGADTCGAATAIAGAVAAKLPPPS